MADGTAKLSGRDYEFQESTPRRQWTVRKENFSGESHSDREEFRPEVPKDDQGIRKDFWSIQGDVIYRHLLEPRAQLYVPKEESFPIPLKCIDVVRSTHTDLDVAQEKRMDDYWNVNGNRSLSASPTGFTRFTQIERNSSKWIHVVREETDKNSHDITSTSHMA